MRLKSSPLLVGFSLAVLFAAFVMGTIYLTMFWATDRSDRAAIVRQDRLVELAVSKMQASIAHDQESATVWDDAVERVTAHDRDWLDANLGRWMHSYFGHDQAFIVGPDDRLVYGFSIDQADETRAYVAVSGAAQELIGPLRKRLAANDTSGVTDHTLSIGEVDVFRISDRPAIVSVKPIMSDTGNIIQAAGREYLHVAVRYLDGDFATSLGQEYFFKDMRFAMSAGDNPLLRSFPVSSKSGVVIGYFTWRPFRPGHMALRATEPILTVGCAIILCAATGLVFALQRRSRRLRESQSELLRLAHHDPLSGLPNRAAFTAMVSKTLANCDATILFLDLDRFKQVNDTLGHAVGDRLICHVAQRLCATAKTALMVSRMGGDEFTMIVPGTDLAAIERLAESLIGAIRQPFDIDGQPIAIGLSIGIAFSADGSSDGIDVLRRADIALYQAKATGRNRFVIFGAQMDQMMKARRELEYDLRSALKDRCQIEVHYQPIFGAREGQLLGVEALARWRHPTKGFVQPDVFIQIAEEAGLITQLGEQVLTIALADAVSWPGLSLSVNASALELRDEDYGRRVGDIIDRFSFDPTQLEIEITESAILEDEAACRDNIEVLRGRGVQFALDDFGTGFSSFGRMQKLDVDRIKIDRCFVEGCGTVGSNEAIVQAMINLAHAQGMRATAEGIETDVQRNRLRELGCDALQGFLLSRPVGSDKIGDIYRQAEEKRVAAWR
ncbi:diguanylate cyclase [Rhizobium sp. Root708]|uniref:putative bifunctional diguanylate cyclase/phosphodiesterase n=1 Tax=Rhizobium sp. Root708 TaxID=1736592 RepID=UPI0007006E35|nr:EAL domain-containing protein [Rhizobium sp. Root708]KRB49258.1 diguanylate cyclase [Rhizobium sp. Root708]